MPTARIILDARRKTKKGYPIKLWISHKGHTRLIPLNIYCESGQFNQEKIKLTGIHQSVKLTNIIRERKAEAELYFAKHNCKPLTCQELKEKLERKFAGKEVSSIYLSEYVFLLRDRLSKNNQHGTSTWYKSALESVKCFHKDIQIIDIDVTFLENFRAYHQKKGTSINGIAMYLRALRAIINKARKENYVPKSFRPFDDIEIQTGKSSKIALDVDQLKLIKGAPIMPNTKLWHNRNYFMFMFYCRGMNFADMIFLERKNIIDGYITYTRRKTGSDFKVLITPSIGEIISRYDCDKFIFPVLSKDTDINSEAALVQKHKSLQEHNRYMNILAKKLQINVNITSYVARHTYVNIAKLKGYDPKQVSESLGHSDSKTTERHYWPEANQELIDKMNRKIITL